MKASRLIIVCWHDAGSGDTLEEAASHVRLSAGFEMRNDELGVWLSMEDDMLSGVHFIPLAMIQSIQQIDLTDDTDLN